MSNEIIKGLNNVNNFGYMAIYYLYNSDSMDIPERSELDKLVRSNKAWKNSNTSCFAQLKSSSEARKFMKNTNRIVYFILKDRIKLSDEDIEYWLDICIKNKMLPKYVGKENVKEKALVVDTSDEKINPSLLYVYLSSFRFMSEDARFVKATIIMSQKYKIPFLLAWLFASKAHIHNTGHSFTYIGRMYGQSVDNFAKSSIPMKSLMGLKRYLDNPGKYDKRKMYDFGSFNANDTVENAGKEFKSPEKVITMKDIENEKLIKILKARTEKTEKEHIKSFYKSIGV